MLQPTDETLVQSALTGDKAAFGQLVARYQEMAMHIALRMVNGESSAQDLVQEAMLQAYLSLPSLRDPSRFRSWLHGVVRNVCGAYLRGQKAQRQWQTSLPIESGSPSLLPSGFVVGPEEIVQKNELNAFVLQQIEALAPPNRVVVLLFYYGRLSVREIAAELGISESAVKNRLYKARRQLQVRLASLNVDATPTDALPDAPLPATGTSSQRRQKMVPITSVHIVQTAETESYIVFLLDQPGRRALPIWVGPAEGLQIMLSLRQIPTTRPWAFTLMTQMLNTLGATIQEVQIQTFTDDSFYALTRVAHGDTVHEMEARTSDAIALAVHTQSPIVVTAEIMATAATLPPSFDDFAWRQSEALPLAEVERMYGVLDAWQQQHPDGVDRFTKRARSAWERAQAEAQRLQQGAVGTEHLLLGMALDEAGVAARVLQKLGIAKEKILAAVELQSAAQPSAPSDVEPILDPRTQKVVNLAAEERRILGHRYIGNEHLLLGIVREDRSAAAHILRDLGLNLGQIRPQILEVFIQGRASA